MNDGLCGDCGDETEAKIGKPKKWWRQPKMIALLVSGALLIAGLLAENIFEAETFALGLYIAALVIGGIYPAQSGLKAVLKGRLNISTLLGAAAAGAVALGIFEEAALLVVVFSLGEALEEYAADRARGAIHALMALVPAVAARREADGSIKTVPVEILASGDVVIVRPGERLPTDGVIVGGASAIDQSPVTGESLPVEVTTGANAFGGTVNGLGALEIRVTKQYAETTLARIIRQVQEAQSSKGQAQRFAEKFGAIYTPIMFALAALVAIVPPLVAGNFNEWFYRALVVLTVSCSCALVLSVPVSVVAAISRAAREGILIKGGVYLDTLAAIRAVAFDKTGTLTKGRPELTDIVPLDGYNSDDSLRLAASAESASEHPLAKAIMSAAENRGIRYEHGREGRAIPGRGVEAVVGGQKFYIGKPNGALNNGQEKAVIEQLTRLEAEGKTAVMLAKEQKPIALIAVADEVRNGAAQVVSELRALGISHILMLTGDNERTAAAIAGQVGIDDYRAGLLPEDKTSAIESLREKYGAIAMVGDGVNDAPALAAADVGIAMGAAGTDVALETADVALMADDLTKLPVAIRFARQTVRNLRQNVVCSLITIVGLVIAALTGKLSLTTGLLLNEGIALLIIANGLRLLIPNSKPLHTRKS